MDSPRARPLFRRALTLALIAPVVALAAACGGGIATLTATPLSPTPGDSGSACLPAPQPGNVDGWQPPSSAPPVIPQVISSDQVCGENRFLFGLLGADNRSLAASDRKVTARFFDLGHDPDQPVATADGNFIWAIDDVVGVYDLNVAFTSTGVWGAEFTTTDASGANVSVRLTFDVVTHGAAVQVGERAPASESRTLADVGGDLAKISSDTDPVERFYTTSIADAVAAHKPFVVVFATPKFCTSAQCGPTLDRLKPVADAHPGVTVINVEPYELTFEDGQLQPVRDAQGYLVPVDATLEWGLPSEPWIYVVDGDGMVRASFEGIVSEAELNAAVDAVE